MDSGLLYAPATEEVATVAREVNFMVRLTPREKDLLDALAEQLGESRSVVVRQAIRELARKEGVSTPEEQEPAK